MTNRSAPAGRVPAHVALFSPILKFLLAKGVPILANRLVTIPGRRSGKPRRVALAVIEISGRRWVWAPWGDVHWVRNLRAAGRATITYRDGREVKVSATELDAAQRVEFFRDTLAPFARRIPIGIMLVRIVDGVDISDPVAAADGRPVFELHATS